jgi:hypothetical protein
VNALLQDEEHPQRLGVKNRLRRIGANLLLLGASLSLSIIVLEVAVRAILPQQLVLLRPDIWEAVDTLGWRHTAGIDTRVNTGEWKVRLLTDLGGFRVGDSGRLESRSDSLLLIGESFMAALQVGHEASLAGLLEDSLVSANGETVAIRKSAVGAWDTPHYRIFEEGRLAQHSYGLALVSVFTGNDIVRQAPTNGVHRGVTGSLRRFQFDRHR